MTGTEFCKENSLLCRGITLVSVAFGRKALCTFVERTTSYPTTASFELTASAGCPLPLRYDPHPKQQACTVDKLFFCKSFSEVVVANGSVGYNRGMRSLVPLAVFIALGFASLHCADAGVMLRESQTADRSCVKSRDVDLKAVHQEKQQQENVRLEESFAIAGFSLNANRLVSQSAAIWTQVCKLPSPLPSNLLTSTNESLPPCPFIDGLLKPS